MRVYLVRHGIAAPAEGGLDEHRPLTGEGRRRFREIARLWAEQGPPPGRWIVSPLVRAVQTCEIALGAFGSEGPVEVSEALHPDGRVSAAAQLVDDRYGETLALVGHQPLLGGLAAFLLGLGTVPGQLEPGAVLALDLPEEEGAPRVAWHLRPGDPPRLLVPP